MTRTKRPAIGHNSNQGIDQLFDRLVPIERIPIDEMRPYERNPRKHSERQMAALMASISQFGIMWPALIDAHKTIIAGEARVEAARRLRHTIFPVMQITHLSDAQVKAYRIADNKLAELSEWDKGVLKIEFDEIIAMAEFNVEITGFSTAEIDLLGEADDGEQGDNVPEPPARPVTRPGDIWQLGRHAAQCGSCLEEGNWDKLLEGKKGHMGFCDPPYNVPARSISGRGKVKHKDFAMAFGEKDRPEFVGFLSEYLTRMCTHLEDGAVVDQCMDWRHLPELFAATEAVGLTPINLCVWNKTNASMGSPYRSQHEMVLIAKWGKARIFDGVELGRHGRHRSNVWTYAGANSFGKSRMKDLADHPTVKPIGLVADAIRDVTRHGDIVLDPFLGSGTTIMAAERTGRIGYGIEIDPGYVDVTIRRWQERTGGEAVLAATGQPFSAVAAERAGDPASAEAA